MHIHSVIALITIAGLADAAAIRERPAVGRSLRSRQNGAQLDSNLIQEASAVDGTDENGQNEAGQSPSATDDANFVNFCQNRDLTNGEQKEGGSCNGIVMGNIPAVTQMVSSLFTSPKNGDDIAANTDFVISVQMINFAPGTFTNPQSTYYSAPQDLDGAGNIIGHTHVTVQDLGGDANPTAPLNPQEFVFFKGINNDGNGQGLLSADVPGGLPAGNYRLCSMASSANHQPVIMPVAQRGAQDDCVRFTVSDGGNNGGNNDDDANNGGNNDDANNGDDAGNDGGNNGDNAGNDDANNGGNNNGGANNGGVNNGDNAGGNDDANNGGNNNGGNNDGGAGNGGNDDANNGGNGGGNGGGAGGASAATALGGIAAPQVEQGNDPNRPFVVAGNSFTDENNAIGRACDIQRNSCLDAVNRGQATGFAVTGCDAQLSACVAELSG